MAAQILDGNLVSNELKQEIKRQIKILNKNSIYPTLATVLVGDDPGSKKYVEMKERDCRDVGIKSISHNLPKEITEAELLSLIKELNKKENVQGILVQLPLPNHINESNILESISPKKDVDGLHTYNMGKLMRNQYRYDSSLLPCTPNGIIKLLDFYEIEISRAYSVVIGRSNLVGNPMSKLLLDRNSTVTICHSRSSNIEKYTSMADIIVSAVGRPPEIYGKNGFKVTQSMVKEDAVVIGTGIAYKGKESYFDIDFDSVNQKASYITPKFGSVGPMTRAVLLENTIIATKNLMA